MPWSSAFSPAFAIGGIGWTELLVIMGVLLLLFGGTQLPKLARSFGQSIIEFKKGVKGDDDDETAKLGDKRDDAKRLKGE